MATVANAIVLKATGVDATGKMLRSLSARLGAFSGMVSAISQRALSGLGDTIREMATLSDRAADARTTSAELRKLAAAMGEIGVRGASIDMVSHAMQEMTRRTGEEGTRGFMRVLASISQVEGAQERATLLAEAFGKQAGAAFAVLTDNGVAGLEQGLGRIADGFWKASVESGNAGDALADKWAQISFGFQTGFQNAIGEAFGFLSQWVDISATNFSKWCATIMKWVVDAFRAIFYAGKWLGTALRGVFEALFAPIKALGKAAWAALQGDFSGAVEHLKSLPGEWADIASDISGELSNVFPEDLFSVPADGAAQSIAETVQEAAKEGSEFIREKLAGRGGLVETAKAAGRAFSQAARSFAGFMGFGTNDARKTAFSRNVDPIERAMLETARRNLDAVESIAETVAEIGVV